MKKLQELQLPNEKPVQDTSQDKRTITDTLQPSQTATKTAELFGMKINSLTLEELFNLIDKRIAEREPGFIVTPNADHIMYYQTDADFREAYHHAFLVLPDGTPLMWASRWLGKPLRQKISGSDLIYWLSEHAAQKGHSIFFLGASEGVAQEAGRRLQKLYPGLKVAGSYSPPLGFEKDTALNEKAARTVQEAAPDICYVALGAPKQDLWNAANFQTVDVPVMIGVGASFDFVTGLQKRAPLWMQKAGLEWSWRLIKEPRRLWRRYLLRDSRFIVLFIREFWKTRLRGGGNKNLTQD